YNMDRDKNIEIVVSYARKDAKLLALVLTALEGSLKPLKDKGLVSLWHDRDLIPGTVAAHEIQRRLHAANIHLLLVSADFLTSSFCYSDEMEHLMERHRAGEVQLIPILLRQCHWQEAPFGELSPLPENGKPLNSWENKDEALFNITEGVRKVVNTLLLPSPQSGPAHEEVKTMMDQPFTHGYALLIGVGDTLPVTVKDATALHDLLIDPGRASYPATQVTLLTEAEARRETVLAAFDRLIQQVKNDPEATVLVYFSGHGGRFSVPEQTPEYFLVPYGYDPGHREQTALSDHEFTEKIEAIKTRKLVVLLDCCHAGGLPMLKGVDETFEKSPVPPGLLNILQAGSGRVVLASSRENEASYTGTPYSVFTACLLEALGGKGATKRDGLARILDLLAYVFEQVPQRTAERQHPFVNKILNLDDNFALCYYAGGKGELPGKPVPLSPTPSAPMQLTPSKRQRLEKKVQDLQDLWKLSDERTKRLQQALAIETDALSRFKYEQQLLQERAALGKLEADLDELEQALQQ
ncbi:MAG TPA: caspase family protein, partial [Ktedonobacteraceae bacterium]|nr:caspase family protein [Ktedonobacteraceae bacterium]